MLVIKLQFSICNQINIAERGGNPGLHTILIMSAILTRFLFFLLFFSIKNTHGQAPDLGSIKGFVLFSSVGFVTNTAATIITGNIGTNAGSIAGFEPPTVVNGSQYIADYITAQAKIDLQAAYDQIANTTATITNHPAAFGAEIITAGVYEITGVGSLTGNLTLNAAGNRNAVFILKFGGGFSVAANAKIILANGALAGNVFWMAEGVISMGTDITMKGTLIAHNGANSLGNGSTLEGRMFSTTGEVSINTNVIDVPASGGYYTLPIKLISFTGTCIDPNILLNWSTASETNNSFFSIEKSVNALSWTEIAKIEAAHNSTVVNKYSFIDEAQKEGNYFYRLKQTDYDGMYRYGQTIFIKNCSRNTIENLKVYPNPSSGNFGLSYNGNTSLIKFTQVFNAIGEKVYEANSFPLKINLIIKIPGIYYVRIITPTTTITKEILVLKD